MDPIAHPFIVDFCSNALHSQVLSYWHFFDSIRDLGLLRNLSKVPCVSTGSSEGCQWAGRTFFMLSDKEKVFAADHQLFLVDPRPGNFGRYEAKHQDKRGKDDDMGMVNHPTTRLAGMAMWMKRTTTELLVVPRLHRTSIFVYQPPIRSR
ncbi:hypothetical protein NL676_011452 [Syzygium grande]|nr:hypothetical protein NL676_011452 [Syzygium grande]